MGHACCAPDVGIGIFCLKKHLTKQNKSLFGGWCHCALCLRLGGASISIGCLPLLPAGGSGQAWIGHRWWAAGPRMFCLFGWMKVGETPAKLITLGEQVSIWVYRLDNELKMCFWRLDINFCMIFVRSKMKTLELPSSVLPWEALTLLYIGGASSSSSLLSCQETDGANEAQIDVKSPKC